MNRKLLESMCAVHHRETPDTQRVREREYANMREAVRDII